MMVAVGAIGLPVASNSSRLSGRPGVAVGRVNHRDGLAGVIDEQIRRRRFGSLANRPLPVHADKT